MMYSIFSYQLLRHVRQQKLPELFLNDERLHAIRQYHFHRKDMRRIYMNLNFSMQSGDNLRNEDFQD